MKKRILIIPTLIILLILGILSVHIIPTGYTGVKTSFGQIQQEPIQSGTVNITIPFVESIHKVNNKQQDKRIEAQIWGEASDKTPVYASDVIVTYQVLPEKSAWIYANVSDIKNLIGEELVASAIKSAMVELTPGEVTARTKIEPLVQQKLAESLTQKYGEGVVFVNKVVINDMDFEEAYNAAIQQKSITQQNADRQKIENAAAIAKAEADKRDRGTKVQVELYGNWTLEDAQSWKDLGITQVIYHRSRDAVGGWGEKDINRLKELCDMGMEVTATGGIGYDELPLFKDLPLFCIICGRSIRNAPDPRAEVLRMKARIDELWN